MFNCLLPKLFSLPIVKILLSKPYPLEDRTGQRQWRGPGNFGEHVSRWVITSSLPFLTVAVVWVQIQVVLPTVTLSSFLQWNKGRLYAHPSVLFNFCSLAFQQKHRQHFQSFWFIWNSQDYILGWDFSNNDAINWKVIWALGEVEPSRAVSSHTKSSACPVSLGQVAFPDKLPDKNRKRPVAQDFSGSCYFHVNEDQLPMLPTPLSAEHKVCKNQALRSGTGRRTQQWRHLGHRAQALLPGTRVPHKCTSLIYYHSPSN